MKLRSDNNGWRRYYMAITKTRKGVTIRTAEELWAGFEIVRR